MAKTCKFYKLKQEVSFDCGETWEASGLYEKGRLYEVNSRDCGFMLIYRWALSQGDYDCDGVRKYNMEVLQFTTEQGGEYQNVSPEYKRRTGGVVEWLSEDCGYVESTGGFKFSGTSEISCGHTGRTGEGNPSVLYRSEVSGITAPHSIVGDCTEVIGEYAFSGTNIQTVDISSYTTEIEDYAFGGCTGLTSMTIPDTVEKVGIGLFYDCINLTGATLPSGLDYIPTSTFENTAVENYVVPNGIQLIGNSAFVGGNGWWSESAHTQDLEITFTTGVTDIGDYTFAGRDFNGTLSLPSSLKYIGREAFRCSKFDSGTELVIPNGVEHIARGFTTQDHGEDPGIDGKLSIPGTVKLIPQDYELCANYMKRVTLHEGTEAICSLPGNCVHEIRCDVIPSTTNFLLVGGATVGLVPYDYGCTNPQHCDGEITIPANVQIMNEEYLCQGYNKPRVVIMQPTTPPLLNSVSGDVYTIHSSPGTCGYDYNSVIGICVPDGSVNLYKAMWSGVASLIQPVSNLVYKWETEMYVSVDSGETWYYTSRTQQHRTTSGTPYCDGVDKYVDVYSQVSRDNGVTWETTATTQVLVEKNSADCGYVPPTPVESVVVTKYNVTDTSSPTRIGYYEYTSGFSSIEIDGVVQQSVVSAYTFSATGEHTVKYTLTDPATVSEYAFYYCENLTSAVIPSGVTYVNQYAFRGCTGLANVDIPDSVRIISGGVFYDCTSLSACTIGSGVTSIGDSAFHTCGRLTNIVIPDATRSIGDSFRDCYSLTSCTIGNGITSINGYAFRGCRNLLSLTVNNSTPPELSSGYLLWDCDNCQVYVPCESVNTYKSASGWRNYSNKITCIPT